jgi:hypothetical protein
MIHFKQHRLQEKTEGEAWLFFTENLREQEKQRSGLDGGRSCASVHHSLVFLQQLAHRVHPFLVLFPGCSWVFLVVGGEEVESLWQRGCSVDGSGWMGLLLLTMVSSFIHLFSIFGVERLMEVGGFPFLSQLSQHMGCSPLFSFLCLFNFFC